MSIKTTRYVTREKALLILLQDLPTLPNDTLGNLLDVLADSRQSRVVSYFDNFIVGDFAEAVHE
jgi:hypothetical protein